MSAGYERGTDINRRPAAGQPPALVDRRSVEVEAAVRAGRHVVVAQTYLRTQLLAPDATGANRDILDNQILRSKLNVHLTRALSLRAILDYERVAANPARSRVRPRQPVGLDLLGSYQPIPARRCSSATSTGWSRWGSGAMQVFPVLQTVGRQAFVKVSWLFRCTMTAPVS
ncbi:MAG: hypothetical protein R2708_17015 [Vicinamibacterales bacterium]